MGGFLAPTINQNNITKLLARAALFFLEKRSQLDHNLATNPPDDDGDDDDDA